MGELTNAAENVFCLEISKESRIPSGFPRAGDVPGELETGRCYASGGEADGGKHKCAVGSSPARQAELSLGSHRRWRFRNLLQTLCSAPLPLCQNEV